ncbi:GrxA family glutaredoxin [Motiliproteus sp. SC1-56]|uniref:GrxA family glutaredoxin n=1 Tax=Motiliproteus sp. SC1-56 TaxID=2799565 RepID=UPI001A8F41CF|nr:GrxA family glutaredoxin [Motiliproteus sp. SC1-56]
MERITIFGREGCGFCRRAKELCEQQSLPFAYFDIHQEGISQADLEKTVGKAVQTVPQIFCGKDYIGGYEDLVKFLNEQGILAQQ